MSAHHRGMKLTLALTVMFTAIAAVPAAPQSPLPTGRKLTLANTMIQSDGLMASQSIPRIGSPVRARPATLPRKSDA